MLRWGSASFVLAKIEEIVGEERSKFNCSFSGGLNLLKLSGSCWVVERGLKSRTSSVRMEKTTDFFPV